MPPSRPTSRTDAARTLDAPTEAPLPPIPSAYAPPPRPRVVEVVYAEPGAPPAPRPGHRNDTPAESPTPVRPVHGPMPRNPQPHLPPFAPRIAARVPWKHLRVVGMLRPPDVVQTGEAAPIYALDASECRTHGLPGGTLVAGRPSFSIYDTEGNVADSLQVTGLWRPGTPPPGELFAETAPQAAIAATIDPTWQPTPTAGRFLAVLRSDVWHALRAQRISPPWRFYRSDAGGGRYTLWVAAVDILAFRQWRRETAWRLLASVRPIMRDARLRGGRLDKSSGSAAHLPGQPASAAASTVYFRVTRLAFAIAPQRSTDRTAMRTLFALMARDAAELATRMAPVRARSTDPDALLRFAEAWLARDVDGPSAVPDADVLPPDLPVYRCDAAVPGSAEDDRPDNILDTE